MTNARVACWFKGEHHLTSGGLGFITNLMIKVDNPLWYQNAIFYEVYVRAFFDSDDDGHGDLRGLMQKLDYLADLGIDCLWLMPIYPSPLKDDGYDIADYYGILPTYGKPDDLKSLIEAAHARNIRVILDLVLNHTSDQHPWFQKGRSDPTSPYRDYYVWSDSEERYKEARIIFLDTQRSNWAWDNKVKKYFWHRFYPSQPDLNFDNPAVQQEMIDVMRYWLKQGVDGFRADAVPYLFERDGTNCENLPETHAYLKRLRRLIDDEYPGRILLCEANQWPEDVRPYFGDGDEFQMGFHFPLMPRLFMALRKEECSPLEWILARTPPIPENCQWCTFLRNHDELTLEMVTEEERQWMWAEYAPEPRMRLNLGIRRRLAPLLDNDHRKIELANSLLFSLPGSPIIYYGDEIGMGDDIWLEDRNGVRTPMQWDNSPNAGFSSAQAGLLYAPVITNGIYGPRQVNVAAQRSDPVSLWHAIQRMIAVRKANPALGKGKFEWADANSTAVAAHWRRLADDAILVFNNLSGFSQRVSLDLPDLEGQVPLALLLGKQHPQSRAGRLELTLSPYEYLWLKLER
jgi:maltose alpha-D-glucosyltransferase/alpha-amylase